MFDNAGPVISENRPGGVQGYVPPPEVELVRMVELGFRDIDINDQESGYDMGRDPIFQSIPHTNSSLSIEIYASGSNWQGSVDESWAIDNFSVTVVPEPVKSAMIFAGALALLSFSRRK